MPGGGAPPPGAHAIQLTQDAAVTWLQALGFSTQKAEEACDKNKKLEANFLIDYMLQKQKQEEEAQVLVRTNNWPRTCTHQAPNHTEHPLAASHASAPLLCGKSLMWLL